MDWSLRVTCQGVSMADLKDGIAEEGIMLSCICIEKKMRRHQCLHSLASLWSWLHLILAIWKGPQAFGKNWHEMKGSMEVNFLNIFFWLSSDGHDNRDWDRWDKQNGTTGDLLPLNSNSRSTFLDRGREWLIGYNKDALSTVEIFMNYLRSKLVISMQD